MAMFCENCGKLLSDEDAVCPVCGTPRASDKTFDDTVHATGCETVTDVDALVSGQSTAGVVTVTATRYSTEDLCNLMRVQYRLFVSQQSLYDRLNEICRELSKGAPKMSVVTGYLAYILVVVGVYLVISGVKGLTTGELPGDMVFGILLFAVCFYYFYRRKRARDRLKQLDKERDAIGAKLYDYYLSVPNKVLCFEYSNPYTISMLYEISKLQRLHTVKDAINAFEDIKVRQKIQNLDTQTRETEEFVRGFMATYIALKMASPTVVYR